MRIRVYLHDEVADILAVFGDLDVLVDKLLALAMAGRFDMESLPANPRHGNTKKYYINVTNEEYLELREVRGNTSPNLSLRRLLYWFVDNEAWEEFDIEPEHGFTPRSTTSYYNRVSRIIDELSRLQSFTPAHKQDVVIAMLHMAKELL